MLYQSTKIVVIGSNAKRRAGPRVGSIGYVCNSSFVSNRLPTRESLATVLFTRYGYEKKQRFEVINTVLEVPKIVIGQNPKKTVNKLIAKVTSSSMYRDRLVVVPLEGEVDAAAGLYCNLYNNKLYRDIQTEYFRRPLNTSNNLLLSMPKELKDFLVAFCTGKKIDKKIQILKEKIDKCPEVVPILTDYLNVSNALTKRRDLPASPNKLWAKRVQPYIESYFFEYFTLLHKSRKKEVCLESCLALLKVHDHMIAKGEAIAHKHS